MKKQHTLDIEEIKQLYNTPLPSSRSGALYNAFSYPTKISPEAIGIFIACHTNVGDTVLDSFAGSGTTGLATKLCDNPTPYMIETAAKMQLNPKWGKRKAILYELSTLGAFVSEAMNNPPSSKEFAKYAKKLLDEAEKELEYLYTTYDNKNNIGKIRHVIWSDVLICPVCKKELTFWQTAVQHNPLKILPNFECPYCNHTEAFNKIPRATEEVMDEVLKIQHIIKKRVPVRIYGKTGKETWYKDITDSDIKSLEEKLEKNELTDFPTFELKWGDLYRKGYHQGITHLHHLYTKRNAIVFASLWKRINLYPEKYQNALKLLLLSYNASHSTLMTRVVVKSNNNDFVITGAQSGVLYISSLPVEKNIIEGVRRKIKTLQQAFTLIEHSKSEVEVKNMSSTTLLEPTQSVDYVFTDPPFGDYIPYSEINQINEAWLGSITDQTHEAIINESQNKGISEYRDLMTSVFSEINRVLKDNAAMSLVFHSAKAEVWKALIESYQNASLKVCTSSILNKVQGSFKQVTSTVKVQGDPLLLLVKTNEKIDIQKNGTLLIEDIIKKAFDEFTDIEERKPERMYSRYINACLEVGYPVKYDANEFYDIVKLELEKQVISHL